ncbi:MAG TPA: hypothetical protein VFY05_10460 [Candidatus Angelobacter sp.]|nr:hypothetical protein [Candidatus Angelobacter sp.]
MRLWSLRIKAGTLDSANLLMLRLLLRLDTISCLLTILSTVMVGRRKWEGWVVAGANSAIIATIGLETGQWGFVPANVFCIAIYLYNIRKWRKPNRETAQSPSARMSDSLNGQQDAVQAQDSAIHRFRAACRRMGRHTGDERAIKMGNRIRARWIPNQRKSHTPL